MRSLKCRVERLEAATPKPREMLTIVVVSFVGARDGKPEQLGELRGFKAGDLYIARQAGESEAALEARAAEVARGPYAVAVLLEDRAPSGG